jgi:RNA polymerase sigma factor (TIGR02999 family)
MAKLYPELRRLAAYYMRSERPGHTLQPTALVHELYVKLMSGISVDWQDRAHFMAFAARKLRHCLLDNARRKQLSARSIGRMKVELGHPGEDRSDPADLVALENALKELEAVDGRSCQVLELRFFAGLTEREAAEVLGISLASVKRDFAFARAWLSGHLKPAGTTAR